MANIMKNPPKNSLNDKARKWREKAPKTEWVSECVFLGFLLAFYFNVVFNDFSCRHPNNYTFERLKEMKTVSLDVSSYFAVPFFDVFIKM